MIVSLVLRLARHKSMQPLWEKLHRVATIGMNFWASQFSTSGEHDAIGFVAHRLRNRQALTVFDVGANVGEFAEYFVGAFNGRCVVHAFEPAHATHSELVRRTAHLGSVVRSHALGVSNQAGHAVLHSSEPCSTIASLLDLERPIRPFDPALDESVELTTIDDFCLAEKIDRIDFLKLDVEGHELAALEGARSMIETNRIEHIQFEFGENNIISRTFLSDFAKILSGYDLFRIVPGGLVPWIYKGGASEIFATMNYLAILKSV